MATARVPSYRLHEQSGQAVVTLTDSLGGRRDVLLGKYGTQDSRSNAHASSPSGNPQAGTFAPPTTSAIRPASE